MFLKESSLRKIKCLRGYFRVFEEMMKRVLFLQNRSETDMKVAVHQ